MNRKIYLSRAQTRAMAFDHPIGDPFGGPAYGEKNDPISTAVALYEVYSAYEIGFAAMTVWQGIATAGAALTLVGNATGNRNLSLIGNLAMAGGNIGQAIGNTAQGGWASEGSLKESIGSGSGSAVSSGSAPGNLAPVQGGATTATATPTVDSGPITSQTAGLGEVKADYSLSSPNVNAPTPGNGINVPGANGINAPGAGGLNAPVDYSLKPAGAKLGTNAAATPGIMDKIASNPMSLYAAATTVGSVADWLSGKTDAEIDAMKAQTGYNNAKALETQELLDREKQRRANLNAGYQTVNTGITVNPNAQMPLPWQQQQQQQPVAITAPAAPTAPGLINGARPA